MSGKGCAGGVVVRAGSGNALASDGARLRANCGPNGGIREVSESVYGVPGRASVNFCFA